jgi:DNA (cytosine-5)-methyltransferase 1
VSYKFIDLFAGIGGFHQAFESLGAECVFASEWDQYARMTYIKNFVERENGLPLERFAGDITKVDKVHEIPDFDILCAGFPCQPFSQAGYKKGFKDERGNLFFEIAEIVRVKKSNHSPPGAIFLENVQHLLRHDGERTIRTIRKILREDLGYKVFEFKVRASEHGLPQHRPRLFIIGMLDHDVELVKPEPKALEFDMSAVWGADVSRSIGFTLRVGGRSSPIDDRRNWDGYWVNGEVERLTPQHGLKMQGFRDDFRFPDELSDAQKMKQLGNSVAVWAVRDYGEMIINSLDRSRSRRTTGKA